MARFLELLQSGYTVNILIFIGIYTISVVAYNINFGVARRFNLAHAASYAVGAYSTALLATPPQSAGFFVCAAVSVLLSGLFAILLGLIAIKLAHDYFAIGTLAFASIIYSLLINWKSLTRGVLGIPGIPKPEIGGVVFDGQWEFAALLYCFVFGVLLLFQRLHRSGYVRALRAQSESESAAAALGWDIRLLCNLSFFLASALGGLAGAFFAYHMSYIDPSSFALPEMIFILTMAIVGGAGPLWGTVWAVIFLNLLPEGLRMVEIPSQYLGPARQLLYATILLAVVWWRRAKLFPVLRGI